MSVERMKCTSVTSVTKRNSLLMNIYAMFLRLGFNNQENLSSNDQITLKKIESYFDMKIRKIIRNHEYAMKNYQDYLARTSNYAYLKEAHQKQLTAINASRIGQLNHNKENRINKQSRKCSIHDKESIVYHRTDIDKLNVTAFCSQTINIDSTPNELFLYPTKFEQELIKIEGEVANEGKQLDIDDDDELRSTTLEIGKKLSTGIKISERRCCKRVIS
ncbi:Cilia- and flagella-associated protein [Schistosoma japonicum]|nr:Cilia- and flagella-associated protein [Schistosoma japonicum]